MSKLQIQITEFSNISTDRQIDIDGAAYIEINNTGANPVTYITSGGRRVIAAAATHQYFACGEQLIYDSITFNFKAGASVIEVIQTCKYEKE